MAINNITQTISTIPEAAHRGVDVQTVFVIKQEDFQDHLQGTTVAELNTLKTQINTTVTGMNIAVETINTKASEASTSATSASASASTATTKASTATTKASEASTSASNALSSENKAKKWADESEDVPVESGLYSAKHWASKASKIVSAGLIDDVTPSTSTVFSSTRSNNTYEPKNSNIQGHISNNTTNPHNVTKSQVGLSNVDNTSDVNKPISTATSTALNSKQDTLVSGTSIKTINGTSILGSGGIVVTATSDFASMTGKPTTLGGYGITDAYTKVAGKGLSTEDYTSIEKTKLAGIAASANNYSLPVATGTVLGGVKAGANITINADGVISASASGGAAATETAAGIIELATTAEAQAGTDDLRAITPLKLRKALSASGTAPIYACRAWVNFDGTTTNIRASGNVSSITDNGVGIYTVNFITAMPDNSYSVVGSLINIEATATSVFNTDQSVLPSNTSVKVTSSFVNSVQNHTFADASYVHMNVIR